MPPEPPSPTSTPPITVEQGPRWLADFIYTPPAWVNPTIKVLGLVVAVLVVYRLHQRDWSIDAETQLAMGRIAATIVGVMGGVLAMANLTSQPYLVDVAVGFAVGWGTVTTALSHRVRHRVRQSIEDDHARLAAGWSALMKATLLVPVILSNRHAGTPLFGGRLVLLGLGVAMVFYNLRERATAVQT